MSLQLFTLAHKRFSASIVFTAGLFHGLRSGARFALGRRVGHIWRRFVSCSLCKALAEQQKAADEAEEARLKARLAVSALVLQKPWGGSSSGVRSCVCVWEAANASVAEKSCYADQNIDRLSSGCLLENQLVVKAIHADCSAMAGTGWQWVGQQ